MKDGMNVDMIMALADAERLSDKEFGIVDQAAHSGDSELRLAAAEVLGIVEPADRNLSLLKKLSHDADELSASEACDSLGAKGDMSCLPDLIRELGSRMYLVRGYAACAYAEIARRENAVSDEVIAPIEQRLGSEKIEWVRIGLYFAMLMLGRREYLGRLLDGLNDGDYRVRSAAANDLLLAADYDGSLKPEIKSFFETGLVNRTRESEELSTNLG